MAYLYKKSVSYPIVDQLTLSDIIYLCQSSDIMINKIFLCYDKQYWMYRLRNNKLSTQYFEKLSFPYYIRYIYILYISQLSTTVTPSAKKDMVEVGEPNFIFKGIEMLIGINNTINRCIIHNNYNVLKYIKKKYYPQNNSLGHSLSIMAGYQDEWSLFNISIDKNIIDIDKHLELFNYIKQVVFTQTSLSGKIRELVQNFWLSNIYLLYEYLENLHFYNTIINLSQFYHNYDLIKLIIMTNNVPALKNVITNNDIIHNIYFNHDGDIKMYGGQIIKLIMEFDPTVFNNITNIDEKIFASSIYYGDYETFIKLYTHFNFNEIIEKYQLNDIPIGMSIYFT